MSPILLIIASWYFTTAFFSVYRKQKGRQSNVLYNEVADGRRRRSERSGTPFRPTPFGTFRGNGQLSSSLGRAALWTFAPQIGRGLSRMATGSGVDQAKCVYNSEVNSPAGCELLACPLGALGPPSPVPGYKTVLKKTLMNKARAATDSPLRAHKENENDQKTECKPMADSSSSAPRFQSDNNAIDTAVCAAQSYERPPRTAIGYIPVLSSSY